MVHTHCEELSLEQQLAGVRELCRHLGLADTERDIELQRQMRFCILNAIAKVGTPLGTTGFDRSCCARLPLPLRPPPPQQALVGNGGSTPQGTHCTAACFTPPHPPALLTQIGFTSTARGVGRTVSDYHRHVHPEVELEAARCGALRGALRMLASPPAVAFLGGPSGGE